MSSMTVHPFSEALLVLKVESLEKKISSGEQKNPKTKIERILTMMENIEKENGENLRKEKFLHLNLWQWQVLRRSVLALGFFSSMAGALASVLATEAQNEMNCIVPNSVIGTTTTAATLIFVAGLAEGIFECFASKRKKHFDELKEKSKNAHLLKMFFESYKEFIESQNGDLHGCVEEIKNAPEKAMSPAMKDRWLSLLIQALPAGSSLKKKLIEQKGLAEEIKNAQDDTSTVENISELPLQLSQDSASSSEDDRSSFLEEEEAVTAAQDTSPSKTPLDLLRENYLRNFQEIQEELKFEVNELNYDGLWFDQACRISDKPLVMDVALQMEKT